MTDNVEPVSAEGYFGAQVRAAREIREWSQEALAAQLLEHTGVKLGQSGVVRLEKGHRPTRLNEALAIARFLGIDLTQLLGTSTDEEIRAAQADLREAETRRKAAAARLQGLLAAAAFDRVGGAVRAFDRVGGAVRAFDQADSTALKTGTGIATLPDGGTVAIRTLTSDEVAHMKALEGLEAKDNYLIATGVTDPQLSEDDVATWAKQAPAGDLVAVSEAIAELSGVMGEGSDG